MTQKTIYYTDELNEEFSEAKIQAKRIDGHYRYGGTFLRPLGRGLLYHAIVKPLARVWLKVKFGHRIVGGEVLKPYRHEGYYLFGNHTNPVADAYIPTMLSFHKGTFVIVHPANVSMPVLGKLTPSLGAVPLPDDKDATRNFLAYLHQLIQDHKSVTIYPEAHIWPYYTKIRPFGKDAFRYPIKEGVPVFCFVNTYQKRKHRKTPRIVTYVDGPFFPAEGMDGADKRQELRDRVYNRMVEFSEHNNVELIHYERH